MSIDNADPMITSMLSLSNGVMLCAVVPLLIAYVFSKRGKDGASYIAVLCALLMGVVAWALDIMGV